jgi:hypothetical protein
MGDEYGLTSAGSQRIRASPKPQGARRMHTMQCKEHAHASCLFAAGCELLICNAVEQRMAVFLELGRVCSRVSTARVGSSSCTEQHAAMLETMPGKS